MHFFLGSPRTVDCEVRRLAVDSVQGAIVQQSSTSTGGRTLCEAPLLYGCARVRVLPMASWQTMSPLSTAVFAMYL